MEVQVCTIGHAYSLEDMAVAGVVGEIAGLDIDSLAAQAVEHGAKQRL